VQPTTRDSGFVTRDSGLAAHSESPDSQLRLEHHLRRQSAWPRRRNSCRKTNSFAPSTLRAAAARVRPGRRPCRPRHVVVVAYESRGERCDARGRTARAGGKDKTVKRSRISWSVVTGGLLACAIGASPAHAQLATQHVKGIVGLKGGTAPPPHTYVIAPVVFVYDTDTVRTGAGRRLPGDADITSTFMAGGVNLVTAKKLLGAHYGIQVLFPAWANNRIQAPRSTRIPAPA
jgi:hypothetical protein